MFYFLRMTLKDSCRFEGNADGAEKKKGKVGGVQVVQSPRHGDRFQIWEAEVLRKAHDFV